LSAVCMSCACVCVRACDYIQCILSGCVYAGIKRVDRGYTRRSQRMIGSIRSCLHLCRVRAVGRALGIALEWSVVEWRLLSVGGLRGGIVITCKGGGVLPGGMGMGDMRKRCTPKLIIFL